jgi:hypothetical protein
MFAEAVTAEPNAVLYQLQERCGKFAAETFRKDYDNGKGGAATALLMGYFCELLAPTLPPNYPGLARRARDRAGRPRRKAGEGVA